MHAAALSQLRDALERCVQASSGPIERCVRSTRAEAENCVRVVAKARAETEAKALHQQVEAGALEAESLRRKLQRTQALCANHLFDLRTRYTLQSCFHALSDARQPRSQSLENFAYGTPFRDAAESDVGVTPARAGLSVTIGDATPRSPRCGTSTCGAAGSSSAAGALPPSGDWWDLPLEVNTRRASREPEFAAPASPRSTRSTTTSVFELVDAEERHDAQIASFVRALRNSKTKLASSVDHMRRRYLVRMCLHALRAHAAERVAWRGSRSRVLLTATLSTRHVARAVLIAWRLAAMRSAERRQQTEAVVAVVSERLTQAEGHFGSLVSEQVRSRLAARDALVEHLAQRKRERVLCSCWLAIRLAAYHHRMIGERQAWRDLLFEMQTEQHYQYSMATLESERQVRAAIAARRAGVYTNGGSANGSANGSGDAEGAQGYWRRGLTHPWQEEEKVKAPTSQPTSREPWMELAPHRSPLPPPLPPRPSPLPPGSNSLEAAARRGDGETGTSQVPVLR